MKVKPKEIMVNLPIALLFDTEDEIAQFASNINTLIHGKVKVKTDIIGNLGDKIVSIFYLQRNNEYHQIRNDFTSAINQEMMNYQDGQYADDDWLLEQNDLDEPSDPDAKPCVDCGGFHSGVCQ